MVHKGRPKLENVRSYKICVRLSSEQKAELESYCARYDLNKTEVIIKGMEELFCRDVKVQTNR